MKFVTILLAAFLIAAPAFAAACPEFVDSITALERAVSEPQNETEIPVASFPATFKNADEVERWAQGSTFGGGRMERAKLAGKDLLFMFRSYTSGIKTSDIGIYVWDGKVYRFVKGIAPVRVWIKTNAYADRIVFTPEEGGQELLVLTPEEL